MGESPAFIITIGTSAGGMNALIEVVALLPADADIAVFIVLHISAKSISGMLKARLQEYTSYACVIPEDGDQIQKGRIYIAPPDYHLLVKPGYVVIGKGPAEGKWRPSINMLFRSAAAAYNVHVVGIILTGLLDDGTAGMESIKRSGGICIVQDPNEAEYPDMPLSVLSIMEVDYCVSLSEIGSLIGELAQRKLAHKAAPDDVIAEAQIAEQVATEIQDVSKLGSKSIFACPDCGGGLWQVNDENANRYRCHIGHAYTERELMLKQADSLENTLWIALRMMEENRNLMYKMANDDQRKGLQFISAGYKKRGEDLERHIARLKDILFATRRIGREE